MPKLAASCTSCSGRSRKDFCSFALLSKATPCLLNIDDADKDYASSQQQAHPACPLLFLSLQTQCQLKVLLLLPALAMLTRQVRKAVITAEI